MDGAGGLLHCPHGAVHQGGLGVGVPHWWGPLAPVSVPSAVTEADELGRILLHQVAGAEVGVTLGEDPPQQLLL